MRKHVSTASSFYALGISAVIQSAGVGHEMVTSSIAIDSSTVLGAPGSGGGSPAVGKH